jgi:hypothetical protein
MEAKFDHINAKLDHIKAKLDHSHVKFDNMDVKSDPTDTNKVHIDTPNTTVRLTLRAVALRKELELAGSIGTVTPLGKTLFGLDVLG